MNDAAFNAAKNHEVNVRPSLKNTPKDLPYKDFLFDRTKDDFADDNAEEFGDGDEDVGWDDAYDYYNEEK